MCQGLIFVYSCRHRQVGEVRLCMSVHNTASNGGCMASVNYMLTRKEPSRGCGDIKTSRRYLLEPCLACRMQADLNGDVMMSSAVAFANMGAPSSSSSSSSARPATPPAETAFFASDPSQYVTRPYVGELMTTSAIATATAAVAIAMPRSVVIASTRSGRSHRYVSTVDDDSEPARPESRGRPESRDRPVSRGRTLTTGSGPRPLPVPPYSRSHSTSRDRSTSRGRSTSRDRASAAISAHNLPGSRTTGRRSQSAARRFATADRLSTVVEDGIPMVPMIPQGLASGNSVGNSVGIASSSSARMARPLPALPLPARRAYDPSRANGASYYSSSSSSTPISHPKGKGKGKAVAETSSPTPKSPTDKGKAVAAEPSSPTPKSPKSGSP